MLIPSTGINELTDSLDYNMGSLGASHQVLVLFSGNLSMPTILITSNRTSIKSKDQALTSSLLLFDH